MGFLGLDSSEDPRPICFPFGFSLLYHECYFGSTSLLQHVISLIGTDISTCYHTHLQPSHTHTDTPLFCIFLLPPRSLTHLFTMHVTSFDLPADPASPITSNPLVGGNTNRKKKMGIGTPGKKALSTR